MRNVFLSFAVLAALAVTAGDADARWFRSYYRSPGYYYNTPRIVYPGASYYGYYPGYSGYYPGYYGSNYYQPRGLSISWSPGYGLNVGYNSGYGYPGYGSIYSPWYGSSYYRGWRW